MPGIVACGRRLHISTDDFFFPGVISLCIRSAWIVLISVVLYFYRHSRKCEDRDVLLIFLTGCLVLLIGIGLFDAAIACVSSRGSVPEESKRKSVPCLLAVRVFLLLPELVWLLLGTVWSFNDDRNCPDREVWMVRAVVISAWLMLALLVLIMLILSVWLGSSKVSVLRSRSSPHSNDTETDGKDSLSTSSNVTLEQQLWQRRCGIFNCCGIRSSSSPAEQNQTMAEVSRLLAEFFSSDVDLVVSDVAAALILVGKIQDKQRQSGITVSNDVLLQQLAIVPCKSWRCDSSPPNYPPATCGEKVDFTQKVNREAFSRVVHFMLYAMAPYGWPLFCFQHLTTGCCRLVPTCRCMACVRRRRERVVGDDCCCLCNTAAIRKWTGLDEDDIIFCSFQNDYVRLPFFVAIDHKEKAVVVGIRGTMSLKDALTDLRAKTAPLSVNGQPQFQAHHGILLSAEFIKSRLLEGGILQSAFSRVPNYQLVLVGHSLGAGVCSLLAIMLQAMPEYKDLMCFAYSPPGGLISKEAAVHSSEFIMSVVLGDDVIPRLSLPTMEDLRIMLVDSLKNTTYPKHRILGYRVCSLFCSCCNCFSLDVTSRPVSPPQSVREDDPNAADSTSDNESPLLARPSLQQVHAAVMAQPHKAGREIMYRHRLFPPGRLLHLVETKEGGLCFGHSEWEARWAHFTTFQEIFVGTKMVSHHLPDKVMEVLEQIENEVKNSPHYNRT